MFVSKVMYAIGFLAVSYLCGRICRVFEDKEAADLNFFTRTLCRFLVLFALPGYLLVGWWLDYFIDGDK